MTKNKNFAALLLAIIIGIFGCGQEDQKNFFTPPTQNSDCQLSINISCASLINNLSVTENFHCYDARDYRYKFYTKPLKISNDHGSCYIDIDVETHFENDRKNVSVRGALLTSILEPYTVQEINGRKQWFQNYGRSIQFSQDGYRFDCYGLSGAGAGINPPASEWVIPNNCPNYNF